MSTPTGKKAKTTGTAATEQPAYLGKRMCRKRAANAARDMRSGNQEAAKYLSQYKKHMQKKRQVQPQPAPANSPVEQALDGIFSSQ